MTKKHKRLSYVDSVKEITVIEVVSLRGDGTTDDPMETVTEYFAPDGNRLARVGLGDRPEDIHLWQTVAEKEGE